jgi:putative tricarboxylic transport membrane protein
MTLNRWSGLFSVAVGMILLFWMIPHHTETVDSGWLKPATLPKIAAGIIIAAGLIHFIFPRGTAQMDLPAAGRALLFFVIAVAGLWLMHLTGFIITAPVLMLVLMLKIGEKRWQWLLTGVIFMPAFIWFCVDFLLKRPLP